MDRIEVNVITEEIKQIPLTDEETAIANINKESWDIIEAERIAAEQAEAELLAAKTQSFNENLPSWIAVETAVDNIANLADAKSFLKKLARVVYWLAKDSIE